MFDVWWDLFGVDFEFVDDLAFIVDFALFDYRGFDLFGFFECEFAFFYFVGLSAGDRAACFDDFVHVVCGYVDGKLVAFFNELVRVAGWANGYHEDRRSPEGADEAPADRHHVALSSFVRANDQEAKVFQFAQRFNGKQVCFYVHIVWWWNVLLKSVSVTLKHV